MNLDKIHRIYFIGIGGIGMSAIARYFFVRGKQVAGYDKMPSEITDSLTRLGVQINFEDLINLIPRKFKQKENTLVVYTPAISKSNKQLNFFFEKGIKILKRAQLLGEITKNTFCLGVSGTHGKTTVSSILGHVMKECNTGATSFLGGIAENYNSNLIIGEDKAYVVEADEFDKSFLELSPNIACVTSVDADHLEIYGDKLALEKSFREFSKKVTNTLIVCEGLPLEGLTYAVEKSADYEIYDVVIKEGIYIFSVKTPTAIYKNVEFSLLGKHNLYNALAGIALADQFGVDLKDIIKSLKTFKGIKRRFSYKIRSEDLVLIDDYAHHPTEINAMVDTVRSIYPKDKVMAVFQPHLFSRTQYFMEEFATSLSRFDELILLDIYPARELPIEGVTSEHLLKQISIEKKQILKKSEICKNIKKSKAKIIIMMGAGDIGVLVEDVKSELTKSVLQR